MRRWLRRPDARITVRPVVVPGDAVPVDGYEIPHTVREAVLLRSPSTAYPWGSSTDRRHLQLDHVEPYLAPARGGPPGQTSPSNLAPLCRSHHRLKTHTGWDYKRLDNGDYAWNATTGHQYDTDPISRRPPLRM